MKVADIVVKIDAAKMERIKRGLVKAVPEPTLAMIARYSIKLTNQTEWLLASNQHRTSQIKTEDDH